MKMSTKSVIAAVAMAAIAVGGFTANSLAKGPTEADLSADIAKIDHQIAELDARCRQYGPGSVLKVQCDLERGVLGTTRAMLDQKRLSWLRGIALNYTVQGQSVKPLPADEIESLQSQMADLEAKLRVAEAKAASYGGLLGTMAHVEAQTQRVSIALLRQKQVMNQLGFSFPTLDLNQKSPEPPSIGKTVNDKDAL